MHAVSELTSSPTTTSGSMMHCRPWEKPAPCLKSLAIHDPLAAW